MISQLLKEQILAQLDKLSGEQQRRVLEFVRALAIMTPTGVQGRQLLCFAGAIDEGDLDSMKQAIETGCERVDLNEW